MQAVSLDGVIARARGEFREMPGLRLTFAQACRLWQLDAETCEAVLNALLAEQSLRRTTDGRYIALPAPRPLQVTSALAAPLRPTG
jgi:hypothetical protein